MEQEGDAPGLIGRAGVWAELTAILDADRPETRIALLAGPAGIGKSTLVDAFAGAAAERGHPVARVSGVGDGKPYAGLRTLLGEVEKADAADPLALRSAVCAELAARATDLPVVLIADDVDRIDAPTLDLLLTLAAVITWGQMPVVALFAARTERVPAELADLIPLIPVPPLSAREAARLLDRLPGAPEGADRLDLLRRAGGNPLALREFAPGATRAFDRRVRDLPGRTLRALTLAAAGERDLATITRADPDATLAAWQPAEEAGLVVVADGTVRFTHPLVEQSVAEIAGPDATDRAHRALAAVADAPRALWHRAAASAGTDPELAAELVDAARRLDAVTAVGLLERAATLSPPSRQAPVLLEAAGRAAGVGRVRWAGEIVDRARQAISLETQPELPITLAALSSWLCTMRGRLQDASDLLTSALRSAPDPVRSPQLVSTAGLPAFLLGEGPLSAALREVLPPTAEPDTLFPLSVVAPSDSVREAVLATPAPGEAAIGAAAMLLDEPEHALRLLEPAVTALLAGTATGVYLSAPRAAGWALVDLGRWVEAEQMLVPLLTSPVTVEATLMRSTTYAQLGVIALSRGRREAAADLLGHSDDWRLPALTVRVAQAQAQAAAAAGEHDHAFALLSAAITGTHFWELLLLPDLAAAAQHTGQGPRATRLSAELTERFAGRRLSTRLRTRVAAAAALSDPDPAAAAEQLTALVTGDDTRRRPFEQAVLAVELADRLRRSAQPRRAGEVLVDALDTFERLDAAGWASRVRGELRAETATVRANPFAPLSAQQEQIARLAAAGLTNREIAGRLFLSPRTVGSHLYRMFPLLGVTNRTQLADLLRSHLTDDAPAGGRHDGRRDRNG
ncbi:transcriptional regulator [Actinoplanes sp. OR16]|uniref:helix-turn-helix transcriptional regulator n=1 Tax=Actinoplanes sp. OR16 TaxID=946334 RepID=UPI000F70D612|nr:LuxR family transcriptional regulator [Actinoplanes sp. OR16]BBH69257.1 transcriptional regulator [Actinoplanes sp. OR16]